MTSYYTAAMDGQHLVLFARDDRAKQVLFGWAGDYGSTGDRGAIELYGQQAGGNGWRWRLSKAGVQSLVRSLKTQIADPARYETSATEMRMVKELLHKVTAIGAGSGLGSYHEQPDFWDHPLCWRQAYLAARNRDRPRNVARAHADAACGRGTRVNGLGGAVEDGLVRAIPRAEKAAINKALEKAGMDGNGRFDRVSAAMVRIHAVLDQHGLSIHDFIDAFAMRQPKGFRTVSLTRRHPSTPFWAAPIESNGLTVTWENLAREGETTRYEVIAYVS